MSYRREMKAGRKKTVLPEFVESWERAKGTE